MSRDLADGEVVHVQGSAARPYELKNAGGVYSCSCPAWRNQSLPPESRTCKHLLALRGEAAEVERVGRVASPAPRTRGGRAPAKAKETAPPVLLAQTWQNDVDLTGWWMSEKLDGVRAYWTGTEFLSRLGNVYRAPEWFLEGLPDHPLDGELWVGRKLFQKTTSIVRRIDRGDAWKEVSFVVFDAPAAGGPFEERLEFLRQALGRGRGPHHRILEQERCRGLEHLRAELARVEALGGEGLMMRQPGSKYVAGRSSTLLKIKSFLDAEARVVGHTAGAGRHAGRTGALEVELPDGTRFSVGTGLSDAQRTDPPPVGSVITFRYQELSKDGVPRFPSFVGVREDVALPPPRRARKKASKAKPPSRRRFELVEGRSSKFWEIEVRGAEHEVAFGRIGTKGQTRAKSFPGPAEAAADAEQLVAEKVGNGYREVRP